MSASSGLALMDVAAYELPTRKWLKLIRPKMRLRVRVQNRHFVSSVVQVSDPNSDETCATTVRWSWSDAHERLSRPTFADDEQFEVEIERRFVWRYECIRRTKPVTLDQVRTGNDCALPLYDRRPFTQVLEDRIEIGEITFTLQDDASSEDTWSEDKVSHTTHA